VDDVGLSVSGTNSEPTATPTKRGPVASTSCLVIVLLAVFVALVVLPALLWLLGIACGGS
jgi:hypothetical protein